MVLDSETVTIVVGKDGRITIPSIMRKLLDIKDGDPLQVVLYINDSVTGDHEIGIKKK